MAENMIKFLRGNVASLPQTATAGAVYFTKDEGLYLGLEDGSYHRYGDFITVADVASLPEAGAHETCMYYCESENVLAKWDGLKWVQINKQKTLAELGGVAKSVYEAKMTALEQADTDNANAISGVNTRLQTVETAIGENGSVTKAIADAQDQADKGVADAAAALAKANEKTTMAEVEAKKYATQDEAKGYADAKDGAIAAAKQAGDDAAAAAGVADGKADAAQAAADKAQGEVDTLETYVGTFTHATAKSVVEYIDAKTSGIATDAALEELTGRVGAAEDAIDAIEADYLKAEDKTELSGKIDEAQQAADKAQGDVDALAGRVTTAEGKIADIEADYLVEADKTELANAIAGEKTRAEGIEAGLESRLKAVEDDYLTSDDKADLQGQINLIMNNPDTKDVIDSINEFTQYIADHGEIADGFRADIDKNKEDIAVNAKAIADQATADAAKYETKDDASAKLTEAKEYADGLNAAMAARVKTLEDIDHDAYVAADEAVLNSAKEHANGLNTAMNTRVAALEAIDHDAYKAADEANLASAKAYTDEKNTDMNTRVAALEAIDHDAYKAYADQAEADALSEAKKYTDALANGQVKTNTEAIATKADQSVLESHTGNTTVHITADERTAWNAAEKNAKDYADGLKTTIDAAYVAADSALKTELQGYADTAESDAVATAKAYTDGLMQWGSF